MEQGKEGVLVRPLKGISPFLRTLIDLKKGSRENFLERGKEVGSLP